MNAARLSLVLASCAVSLAAPPSSRAGLFSRRDDCAPCTRNTRAETDAERCNARQFESLDCAGLRAYAEGNRMMMNQRIASTYYRPVAASAPAPGGLPQLRPLPTPYESHAPGLSRPESGSGEAKPESPEGRQTPGDR